MEVEEEFIKKMKNNDEVRISGEIDQGAILCTENETYKIKVCETSNSLVVIGSTPTFISSTKSKNFQQPSNEVMGIFSSCFELCQISPTPSKVIEILNKYPYKGPLYEKQYNSDLFHGLHALAEHAQCSKFELLDILLKIDAILIDGVWRIIDEFYVLKCIIQIISLINEKQWHFTKIPVKSLVATLVELFPSFVIYYSLSLCSASDNKQEFSKLLEANVAKFAAIYILHEPGSMMADDFYFTWNSLLPTGMRMTSEYLKGVAIEKDNGKIITYFSKSKLSLDPILRFNQIFEAKEKWTRLEIEPYIMDLIDKDTSVNLLAKFCNKLTEIDGSVYYIKKTNLSNLIFN
ncbi:hypothetical protein HZS_778 [Henneguya salminicola]|nr:hypothetical protein HZS_778 [Henneguya salminicola]